MAESAPQSGLTDFSWPRDIKRVGSRDLASIAKRGMRVTIAFTDATRACPDSQLIGFLLEKLNRCGVIDKDVTLLCATGLHRPMSESEKIAKLGNEIVERVRVINHNALDERGLVKLGEIDGIPVIVNRLCVESELLISTGTVEPHQYVGYSGGAKTVVIGCGGEATIRATHGHRMLERAGVRLGAIDGNPFQSFIRRAGVGVDFALNVLLDTSHRIVAAAIGAPTPVHDYLVERARTIYEVAVERSAHMALAGADGPKSCNLYQASRAATYLALAGRTPLLRGAPILLPAAIPEGAGNGTGERRFYECLARAKSPSALLEEMRQNGFSAGAQRAYIVAQTLVNHPIIVVGAENPEVVRECHMLDAPDIASGIEMAEALAREHFQMNGSQPLDFLVVPHALLTLPSLAQS